MADNEHQDLQNAMQSAIDRYVASHYHSEMSTGGVYSKDGRLSVVVTGEKNNLKNFWSGKWSSTWALAVEGLSVRISGDIKVRFSSQLPRIAKLVCCCLLLTLAHAC